MKTLIVLCLSLLLQSSLAQAATVKDLLTVRKVDGRTASLDGNTAGLKVGDEVYFARTPFHFTVTEVKGEQVTIGLPASSDVAVGQTMLRSPTDAMKKAIDTETRLKKALEE